MITLYGKTGCPYTIRAIGALDAHGLSFIKKNIADPLVEEELMKLGGKHQVPYIVDGDVCMYESNDIIDYIEKTYGSDAHDSPRVLFVGGNTCVSA
jgi:glutathione S-transferase